MSKYDPLCEHLRGVRQSTLALSFSDVERIIEERLPASARRHQAWWGNEQGGTHVQALAWIGAGWRVELVDLEGGTVRFRRS